jgi:very-short-patch-repair endonuclease
LKRIVLRSNDELLEKSRELRKRMTLAEVLLWSKIRSRQVDGYKFRRQQPLLDFIVDFYCHDLKLIIEVDGEAHYFADQIKLDKYRDKIFKLNGYNVFRISNDEVISNLDGSVDKLKSYISTISSPF